MPAMPSRSSPALAPAAALLAAVLPLPAQAQPRPLVGRVVDAEGRPAAAAQVTAAWNPADDPDLAPAAVATATADARGYFAVAVPAGQPVYVWALAAADAHGARAACACQLVAIGAPRVLELRLAGKALAGSRRIAGLEAWRDRAPFRLRVHPCPFVGLGVDLEVAPDGAVQLPPLPGDSAQGELLDRDGDTLAGWPSLPVAADARLPVPPPQRLPVLAVDPAGQPVAGAQILQRSAELRGWSLRNGNTGPRERWRLLATTGADGRAVAVLPLPADPLQSVPGEFVLLARKDGCADSHSGYLGNWFADGKRLDGQGELPPKELRFLLAPAAPLRGRLHLPGEAVPGGRLRITWNSKVMSGNNSWHGLARCAVVEVAGDGAFALPGLPLDAYGLAFATGPRRLAASGGAVTAHVALMPSATRPGAACDPTNGGGARVEVRSAGADGGPRQGALGFVAAASDHGYVLDPPAASFALDLAGHADLWLPRGEWLVGFTDEQGFAVQRAAVADEPLALDLRQQPFEERAGIVVDAAGAPVAGAQISVFRTTTRGMPRDADGLALDAIASLALQRCRATTGADGRFRLRFLSRPGRTFEAHASLGDKQSDGFLVQPGDEELQLVLR